MNKDQIIILGVVFMMFGVFFILIILGFSKPVSANSSLVFSDRGVEQPFCQQKCIDSRKDCPVNFKCIFIPSTNSCLAICG
ncbi:Uncharacterised protein [uncultured archaeon]|nr:Uncharacterised protein [uncultured archaeon]